MCTSERGTEWHSENQATQTKSGCVYAYATWFSLTIKKKDVWGTLLS